MGTYLFLSNSITVKSYLYLYCTGVLSLNLDLDARTTQDEAHLLRAVGLARLRGISRGGDCVLEGAHRVLRRMKIEPSSGGEEIHLRRLREEIRGWGDPLQEIAGQASRHALP